MKKFERIARESVWAIHSISNFPLYFAGRLGLLGNRKDILKLRDRKFILKLRNGIQYYIRPHLGELEMVEEIWHREIYDPLLSFIKDGSTVVDIGANIGIFSLKASRAAKNVHVIACEPIAESAATAKENALLNGADIDVRCVAVAGKSGELQLFQPADQTEGTVWPQPGVKPHLVPCVSLADLLGDTPSCDFLKMDCEGAEEEIIMNAPREVLDKIKSMSIEWHDGRNRYGMDHFISLLANAGYQTSFNDATKILYAWRDDRKIDR
jgi:FkbM family methyltransferase